jgi:S-DNA-T family DNA segregation ATPase FtsK/SpoIIIE
MIRTLLKRPEPSLETPGEPSLELRQSLKTWLQDFGMKVDIASVQSGPVITRFELDPAPGLKAHQISQLGNDLLRGLNVALKKGSAEDRELLAPNHIRVVEVTPDKSTVMLEVPNRKRPKIYLRDIIESDVYKNSNAQLPLALGKDFNGNPVLIELDRIAHLLLAGAAGSGISVALKTMLISILCKVNHARIEFLLVDPAMLELSAFKGISYPPIRIVSADEEITVELNRCVEELKRRNSLLADLNVANIDEYNRKVSEQFIPAPKSSEDEGTVALGTWPFKVIMVADLADFMAINTQKFENDIELLARRGRAVGIHMILATQRPSSEVINNRLKSNIPCRIAFQVASAADSRHVLDQAGAETLLGQGDMLLLRPGHEFAERIHGAMVGSDEIEDIVKFLRQSGPGRQ